MRKSLSILTLATVLLFTSSVVAADKVVVIPLSNSGGPSTKHWGQGRTGVGLLTHNVPSEYCTTNGINYALSETMATWYDAAQVCPANTWVCSYNELPDTGSCPIQTLTLPAYASRTCAVAGENYDTHASLEGWTSDLTEPPEIAYTKYSSHLLGGVLVLFVNFIGSGAAGTKFSNIIFENLPARQGKKIT